MVVMKENMKNLHTEIDMVTTPDGAPVAMAHCNNCTSDLNAWVSIFREFLEQMGIEPDMNKIFSVLYNHALEGDPDCGRVLAYNYYSGEPVTGFNGEGRPLLVRRPDSAFNLANWGTADCSRQRVLPSGSLLRPWMRLSPLWTRQERAAPGAWLSSLSI